MTSVATRLRRTSHIRAKGDLDEVRSFRAPAPEPTKGLLPLIGATPMVELTRLAAGPCRLFLKLEGANPGGSIKDRPALAMIEAAERDGRLKPGGTIVEATAGNTGLGLALVAAAKGYRLILVIPDKMSREKIFHLRAMGAEIVLTRSDVGKGHPEYYQDKARASRRRRPARYSSTSSPTRPIRSPTNSRPAPEIYEQLEGDVDAIVLRRRFRRNVDGLEPILRQDFAEDQIRARRSCRLNPQGCGRRAHRCARREAGLSKGLARISFQRSPISRASAGPTRSRRRIVRGGADAAQGGGRARRLLDRERRLPPH